MRRVPHQGAEHKVSKFNLKFKLALGKRFRETQMARLTYIFSFLYKHYKESSGRSRDRPEPGWYHGFPLPDSESLNPSE